MSSRQSVPEGVEPVSIEGRDLNIAISSAAEALGIHPKQVDYKLDLSHFRSSSGGSVARTTVKILAWGSDRGEPPSDGGKVSKGREVEARDEPSADEAPNEAPKRKPSARARAPKERVEEAEPAPKPRERPPPRARAKAAEVPENGAGKPDQLRGAEESGTESSAFAQAWFEKLLELMSVEGKVVGTGSDDRVHLAIDAERAGRIVGKRGATLGAIRHLLGLALEHRFGNLTVDVDVGDDRPQDSGGGGRRERSRGRDRGGRSRDRGGDRDRRDRGPKGKYPEDKLRALARRGAEKALESGRTFTINLELNSYDRRVVHLEISEIEGVDSQSEEREVDGRTMKYIQIIPL